MTMREDPKDALPSSFEEAGLPDLEDGAPQQRWARDPERAPVPGDEPAAAEDYGTTFEEMHDGEPLDLKLEREEPDFDVLAEQPPRPDPDRQVGRLVAEGDDGVEDSEKQELGRDVGTDLGGASAEEAAMHLEGD